MWNEASMSMDGFAEERKSLCRVQARVLREILAWSALSIEAMAVVGNRSVVLFVKVVTSGNASQTSIATQSSCYH